MYFGHIANYQPAHYPKAIQFALDYLKQTDFEKMEAGVYELKGRAIFIQVLDLTTQAKAAFQPEVHRNYLDVQYLHKGKEMMPVAADLGNNPIAQVYSPERDIQYYAEVSGENEFHVYQVILPCFFLKILITPLFLMVRKVFVKL